MIGFLIGTSLGLLIALLYGRFRGRAGEIEVAVLMPFFTYLLSLQFYGNFGILGAVAVVSTPIGNFVQSRFSIGLDTALAIIVAVAYIWFRSKGALSVDEYLSAGLSLWAIFGMNIGLMATAGPGFMLLGFAVLAILIFLSIRNPFQSLNAAPCGGELGELARREGFNCLSDRTSYSVYKVGYTIIVGGKLPEEFPQWREVVECMLTASSSGVWNKVLGYGFAFLPGIVGVFMEPGLLALLLIPALAFVLIMLQGSYNVRRTRKNLPKECGEVMDEYAEFYRRKVKEKDRKAIVID
ncbi:hypothetical protein A3L09_00660 [Thermococcus profundus]|uniref:Uncharacterized protein n=1 Tax=Thermococcus profundus TaxID=49899 RepID=A0A2Z2M935_THEPR|nr:hypothetical protein [Thermococcus profundus]ASJ01873.1 hypothetical protein A3L09_00660 [Thermococcus profundus]